MSVHMFASTYVYSRMNFCLHVQGRGVYVSVVLLMLLTSLLTELLGQSILENDLSSMCCCGSKRQK